MSDTQRQLYVGDHKTLKVTYFFPSCLICHLQCKLASEYWGQCLNTLGPDFWYLAYFCVTWQNFTSMQYVETGMEELTVNPVQG